MSKFNKNKNKIDYSDFYSTLGLSYIATEEQIRESYRALAIKYHPDTGTEEASESIFQKISEAYTVLSNRDKRKDYDQKNNFHDTIKAGLSLQRAAEERLQDTKLFENNNSSIIGNFRGDNLNSKSFNQHIAGETELNQKDNQGVRGERLYQFTIDGLESMSGCTRDVAISHKEGTIKLPVRIPQGVSNEEIVRIVTPSNDPRIRTATLKVKIIVKDSKIVKRQGLDVVIRVPISLLEAIKGCRVKVPLIDGSMNVEIPPQNSSLETITIKGKGVEGEMGRMGDLIVEPFIVLPDMINDTIKAASQAIEEAYNRDIRAELPKTF